MDYLSLSRAARLAGVTRAELQRRIRRGEIATFEGSVAVSDLLRAFPAVSLTDDAALERVERIKSDALPKTEGHDAALPSPQVLVARLRAMSKTLVERMSALSAAEDLLDQVGERLKALADAPPDHIGGQACETRDWFLDARTALIGSAVTDERAQLFAKDTFLRIMAANVKLIPSGHDYFVEGNESILDASVRAGINLNYGCASGNCGACKGRLISGETRRIREHDYVLSEREKAMGYLLTCSHTAVTDVVIEAAEALCVNDLPHQEIRASLRKLEQISENLVALNVQTPRTQTLRFMSGQRVRLTLEDGASRELPIASCPCNARNLWFYVRRGTDTFSEAVFKPLHPGHLIAVEGPYGRFVLTEDAPEPAVFIAFGDGIAPAKSLIEHAISIDVIESFHLYWDTQYPEGHHQGRWGRALTDALDNFQLTPLMSGRAEDVFAVIRADHPDLRGLRFYLAGPEAPIGRLADLLRSEGVADDRIACEITET
ncbi:2Fe-2S iron-sulfur cluster-binding protein [Thiocapsa bogorovii]|uniref:2Fe-2S iron-sulfur cluster-binding protein n=1 Tax=Thiocapsa bogorovii TaxID=521689 RepID=UPI001E503B74|nr:2Fe-2S iron-sulfur cluster-binding protein [Thiocapsa bogorovii]UHD15960.1 2Fe-2S iron-sulfur cluster-binding protein [Thiocapsa bogorovii]